MTHSVLGALPLSILITNDEKVETLVKGFQQLKGCFNDKSFNGRGKNGPILAMTDNCVELHEALVRVWPGIILLLCTFHILQQVWRWLCEGKHGIPADKRQSLLLLFKKMVFANNEDDLKECYNKFVNDDIVLQYSNYKSYIIDLCEINERWAHCYRRCMSIRGNQTNLC